jgi:hypothetical protein
VTHLQVSEREMTPSDKREDVFSYRHATAPQLLAISASSVLLDHLSESVIVEMMTTLALRRVLVANGSGGVSHS